MRKLVKAVMVASGLVAVVAAAPALYAHDTQGSHNSMMEPGMSNGGGMMGGGNMMGQMNAMMETCNKMMQGMMDENAPRAPNDQWRNSQPDQPE